jgi:hypothetical protein
MLDRRTAGRGRRAGRGPRTRGGGRAGRDPLEIPISSDSSPGHLLAVDPCQGVHEQLPVHSKLNLAFI